MFWGYVCMAVAFFLGGLIGSFDIVEKLAMVTIVIFGYIVYFIAINFCSNLRDFLLRVITFGALVIAVENLIQYIQAEDFLTAVIYRQFLTVGSQNINVASLYIAIGVVTSFGLGYKKRKDFLYFVVAIFLELSVCLTFCRMNIALSGLAFVCLFLLSFAKSTNKIEYSIVVSTVAIIALIYEKQVSILLGSFLSKFESGANGRELLWVWCWQEFLANPIFGIGFVAGDAIPGLSAPFKLITAHNSVLQYLTSVGIVGTALMGYFYFLKYKVCIKKPLTDNKFLLIMIIFIELTGITDQAATMDVFILILVAITIGAIEGSSLEVRRVLGYSQKGITKLYSLQGDNVTHREVDTKNVDNTQLKTTQKDTTN